jgi:hypothetical protein
MSASLRVLRTSLIAFVFSSLAGTAAAGDQDFTLVNKTGVEIHKLYASPHTTDDWEEDVLGDDTLPANESVDITFSPKEQAEFWDLRVEDDEGNAITWTKLNLLEISQLTLHYKGGKAWAVAE